MKNWTKLSSKVVFSHPRLDLVEDTVQLPSGEIVPYLKFNASPDAVTIIARQEGKIMLQREYSYPPNKVLYQFPGGGVEAGETPETAAARELREESGCGAGNLNYLGWYYMDNRRSDAKMHVIAASELQEIERFGGDREEDIETTWLTQAEMIRKIASGEITNYAVLAGWSLYAAHQHHQI